MPALQSNTTHQAFLDAVAVLMQLLLIISISSCDNQPVRSPAGTDAEINVIQDTGKALQQVSVLPYWVPSAQFAGYYVGVEKGIFKKHGIDLEILPFDPLMPVGPAIQEKKTDFAILWLVNALVIKDEGVDIVNIAQFSSRSSLMLITKKSSGISKLEDMNGKRAGIWIGYEVQPRALFKKYKLDVEIVNIGSTNNLFLWNAVDILNANWFDEYHAVVNSGMNEDELNKFFFADYGLNFLEDGVYCLSEKAREDPELCVNFIKATLESWNYAFNNQEETVEIVENYARKLNQPVNRSHQRWMLSRFKELYIPAGSDTINTRLQQKDYESVRQIILESKLISKSIPYLTFYKPYSTLPESH